MCDKKSDENRRNAAGSCPNQDVVDKVCISFVTSGRTTCRSTLRDPHMERHLLILCVDHSCENCRGSTEPSLERKIVGECSATTNVGVALRHGHPVFLSPPPAARSRAPVMRRV